LSPSAATRPSCRRASGLFSQSFRVSADLSRRIREQYHRAARIGCVSTPFPEDFKMGMLDQVIAAALASRGQPPQAQAGQSQPAQDQFSPIRAALTQLLAARSASGSTGQVPAAPVGQQNPTGGLDALINQFKQNGLESVIKSWIGTGKNEAISPPQLRQALGQERIDDLSRQTGAPQDDLLSQLSKYLPGVIDRLTPNGQLPNETDLRSGPRRN
jgi:uncharacterized protein YidB (DUF937 family)